MQKLSAKDKDYFLNAGALTTAFLDKNYITEMIMRDYDHKLKSGKQASKMESLLAWIAHVIKLGDKKFITKYKFKRTAQEIWESGLATGCTDYAILFATFARQLGLPTTFLCTAEYGWLQNFLEGNHSLMHHGHAFCECFYDDKWILIDAANKKVIYDYNPAKIELPYKIGPSNIQIPYFRGLDLGKKSTIKDHNLQMDNLCRKLK